MAAEIQFTDTPSSTDYVVLTNSVGQWYNTATPAFEAFNASNFTDYDLAATEAGATGFYTADMPTVAAGAYNVQARRRAGGSPAVTDTVVGEGGIEWDGSAVTVPGTVAQVADKLLGRNIAGGSDGGRTVAQAFAASRNKVAFDVPTAGSFTVYATDDTTPLWTGTYTASAGADPVTAIDPT